MTINKVIARAWTDSAYKSKLIDSPHDALAEMGMNVREGTKVTVLQNTAQNTCRASGTACEPGRNRHG